MTSTQTTTVTMGGCRSGPQFKELRTLKELILALWRLLLDKRKRIQSLRILIICVCRLKMWQARHTQMHQATQSPWHCVGIQTADVTTPASSTPLGPPSALPMLVPIYFAPYAPTLTPSVHFASPLHTVMPPMELSVRPPLVTSNNQSTQAVSTQSTLNSPHPHLLSHENTATTVSRPPELPSRCRSAQKHVESSQDDSESEWDDMKRLSSPPTPTTPLSSPDHKAKLKRAMAPYPVLINTRKFTPQNTPNVKEHCPVTNSEVSQPATESGRQTEYIDYKKRPVLDLSTAATMEERSDDQAGPTPRPEGNRTNSFGTRYEGNCAHV